MIATAEEVEYYRNTLESGLNELCGATGVSSERYDTDQADGECYMDCFREMASLLKKYGVYYCEDSNEFKRKRCQADRDGDCIDKDCPQLSDRQSHCPLD